MAQVQSKKRLIWRGFWLAFLAVSLAFAWFSFYAPANSITWAESYTAAQQASKDSGKPMVLFFTGEWCSPCRIMKRQVWADAEVAAAVNAQYIPVALDVDAPENSELMTRYSIIGPPVTIVTDSEGNALRWRAGRIGKTEFFELLAQ